MLAWVYNRVRRAASVSEVLVATSDAPEDNAVVEFCKNFHIPYVVGSLNDVAGRFLTVLDAVPSEAFVRITGDSPFCDPDVIEGAIQKFQTGEFDLVTNTLSRSYPKGVSVEVIRSESFRKAYPAFEHHDDREHITQYFYRHQEEYRILNFSCSEDLSSWNLSVDTQEDFDRIDAVLEELLSTRGELFTWKDACDVYRGLFP